MPQDVAGSVRPEFRCPAVIEDGQETPADDMAKLAAQARDVILARGYPSGARIVVSLGNTAQAVGVFFGLMDSGLVVVPLNTTLPAPEQQHILDDADPVALICERLPEGVSIACDVILLREVTDPGATPTSAAPEPMPDEAEALILYTSGSTGRPKGVKLSRGHLRRNGPMFGDALFGLNERDVVLLPMELSSVISVTLALATHHAGAALAIARTHRPDALVETLQRARVTMMMTVTTVAELLLKLAGGRPDPFPDLRIIVIGGNYVMADLADRLGQGFGARVDVIYATTECAPTTYLRDRHGAPDGAVGPAAPDVEIAIVDPDGRPVAAGEAGELVVSGPNVALGYWTGPDDKAMDFNGRFGTGDLGYRNTVGNYHIIGRSKELIKSGGLSVYPPEVETALSRHPAVATVAVVGKPHATFGEIVMAFVVLAPGHDTSAAELISWSKSQLASGKCPRAVRFVTEMPRTSTGKIAKAELRSIL